MTYCPTVCVLTLAAFSSVSNVPVAQAGIGETPYQILFLSVTVTPSAGKVSLSGSEPFSISIVGGSTVTPEYQFNVRTCLTAACAYTVEIVNVADTIASCTGVFTLGVYGDVNITGDGTRVCDVFEFEDNRDQLRVDIRLVIPNNAPPGVRLDTMTATAVAVV